MHYHPSYCMGACGNTAASDDDCSGQHTAVSQRNAEKCYLLKCRIMPVREIKCQNCSQKACRNSAETAMRALFQKMFRIS